MNKTEVLAGIRSHAIWRGMIMRCTRPKTTGYQHYGGRGISVCERWNKFENFLDDMGLPKDGDSLDRIDPNGNYEPRNCRWATRFEQGNNRRNNRRVTLNGETLTLSEWARKLDIPRTTIVRRYREGLSPEEILQKDHREPNLVPMRRALMAHFRSKTHCIHGHEFTKDNLYLTPEGRRCCKICRLERKKKFNAKQRLARHARGLKNKGRWAHLPPP